MVVNRVILLTNVFGNDQFPGAVVIGKALCNQKCRLSEALWKVGVDVVVQFLRGTAPVRPLNIL